MNSQIFNSQEHRCKAHANRGPQLAASWGPRVQLTLRNTQNTQRGESTKVPARWGSGCLSSMPGFFSWSRSSGCFVRTLMVKNRTRDALRDQYARHTQPEHTQLDSQTQLATRSESNSQKFNSQETVARHTQNADPNSQRVGACEFNSQYAIRRIRNELKPLRMGCLVRRRRVALQHPE